MFHVIFIFSDWILIKQIIVSSTPLFLVLGETDLYKKLHLEFWVGNWAMSKNA